MPRALTGIKPSGTPHIGNYAGMIRGALDLVGTYDAYYFVADEHALTTVHDPAEMRRLDYEVAATWIALGLDPDRTVVYRQSDIPEVFELAWILSCVTPKGLLNRAHAYKAAVDENVAADRPPDDGVSMGLFNYPVLMAADILVVDADVVPVGGDQRQHVEMARDIAESFNRTFGDVLVLPEPLIDDDVATIGGLDGRKMSKNYRNVIPLFPPADQRKAVMRIVTDSRPPEAPKDPDEDNLFRIYEHFAPTENAQAMRSRYLEGGVGYGEVKKELADVLEDTFGPAHARYVELMSNTDELDRILADGARRAREVTSATLSRVRRAVGLEA
jgi:tryptophanyl-tRNA synthetase